MPFGAMNSAALIVATTSATMATMRIPIPKERRCARGELGNVSAPTRPISNMTAKMDRTRVKETYSSQLWQKSQSATVSWPSLRHMSFTPIPEKFNAHWMYNSLISNEFNLLKTLSKPGWSSPS